MNYKTSGRGGYCPFSAGSTSGGGGGGVLSIFGRFNEWGGGGVLSIFGQFNEWGGLQPPKPLKLRAKKKDFGHKGGGGGVVTPNPPPPPSPVSAPELSESVQTLPEFYLSLKYYKYSTTIPFASGLCSQYRLTVAVSEKFSARERVVAHNWEKNS